MNPYDQCINKQRVLDLQSFENTHFYSSSRKLGFEGQYVIRNRNGISRRFPDKVIIKSAVRFTYEKIVIYNTDVYE